MDLEWIVFESSINFLEMLTSCFFATRLFRKEFERKKDVLELLLFAACGTIMLTFREIGIFPVFDFVPALIIFFLYSLMICHAKLLTSALWALLNYLLIGAVSLSIDPILCIILNKPLEILQTVTAGKIITRVLVRLEQLLLSEVILKFMKRFQEPVITRKRKISLIAISMISIALLMALWNMEVSLTNEMIFYFNISICLLVLILNFVMLFFQENLSKEKVDNEELKEQNRMIRLQIRSQKEVSEMYQNMRMLKHDMNNHLYTISGYLHMENYEMANEYIEKIIGEVSSIDYYGSGNSVLDVLIGSKSALAKKQGIRLEVDMAVPASLKISDEHLVVVVGNLYDNAIDANLEIKEEDRRFIWIQIQYRNGDLILSFVNAAIGEDRGNRTRWLSTKKDAFRHGFGIKNIDRIVKLYGGYSQRELKDNMFICRIRIPDIEIKERM